MVARMAEPSFWITGPMAAVGSVRYASSRPRTNKTTSSNAVVWKAASMYTGLPANIRATTGESCMIAPSGPRGRVAACTTAALACHSAASELPFNVYRFCDFAAERLPPPAWTSRSFCATHAAFRSSNGTSRLTTANTCVEPIAFTCGGAKPRRSLTSPPPQRTRPLAGGPTKYDLAWTSFTRRVARSALSLLSPPLPAALEASTRPLCVGLARWTPTSFAALNNPA
mmetsp:Transcript_5482/g.19826  ORF Transcript_5482/g.19826 Transcript_5482/m.19826 type:complete len:227 (-) Transcript_5482:400-1080(-)